MSRPTLFTAGRLFRLLPLALVAIARLLPTAVSAADGFDPRTDGNIYALLLQPDGKIVVGGSFTNAQSAGEASPLERNRLARFNADGSLDTGFNTGFDGDVTALALQSDGRILVGGKFTAARTGGATVTRRSLARLNADGSLDPTFQVDASGPLNGQVYALAVQADGRIVAGGAFTALQPRGTAAPVARQRLARLNRDGTLDNTFAPQFNNLVFSLAFQADGRLLVGGGFTTIQLAGQATPVDRKRLARFNADGSLDGTFDPRPDNRVLAIALQKNGAILIGGDFRNLQPPGDQYSTNRNFVARLHASGALDGDFNPAASASVNAIVQQSDGRIVVGGSFTVFRPNGGTTTVSRSYLARLNFDGTLDASFWPQPNAQVTSLALQRDGRLLVGGYFTRVRSSGSAGYSTRHHLARLQPDGTLDAAFVPETTGSVAALARQSDGSFIVGGSFVSLGGITRTHLARVRADGTVDAAFKPQFNGGVNTVAVQSDGKILVGGMFTAIGYTTRNNLARLNADGSLDTAFDPNPNGAVQTLVLQSDGKILIGGSFLSLQPNAATTTTGRNYFARLNADGTVDSGFSAAVNNTVQTLVLQSDGKILLGGAFTSLQPSGAGGASARNHLARLNADGTLDTGFNPDANAPVFALVLQSDGKILVGGAFTTLRPHVSTDKIADADDPVVSRNRLARLNADGAVDTAFNPDANGVVYALAARPDGRIAAGGLFTSVGGRPRMHLALLDPAGAAVPTFDVRVDDAVVTLLPLSDNSLMLGGRFGAVQPAGGNAVVTDSHLVRIAADGTVDSATRPAAATSLTGTVEAVSLQRDGRLLIGGSFEDLGGSTNRNLIRYNPDGSPDTTFTTSTDGAVHALLALPDPSADSRTSRFAWLTANGSVRPSFGLKATSQLNGQVQTVLVQADGKVILGGAFVDRSGAVALNLARFFPDGTPDTAFRPEPNNAVTALALDAGGRLLVVGSFNTIGGVTRNYVARLNVDGSVDSSFDPNANAQISAVIVEPDGRILLGGSFTTLQPNGAAATTTRNYLARVNADGTLDTNFNPNPNAAVHALVRESDGQIVLGGAFTTLQPNAASATTARAYVARINPDGTLDTGFNPTANGAVSALALQSSGHLILGGAFTTLQPNGATTSTPRNFLARVNADGTLDANFAPNPNAVVSHLAVDSSNRIYLCGQFTTLGSGFSVVARNFLARLDSVGALDTGFNPNADNLVRVTLPRADGTVLIAGDFSTLRPDAVTVVGGAFSWLGGVYLSNLARLNADGNVDSSFNAGLNSDVYALVARPDRSIVAGGSFTRAGNTTRRGLARFAADGSFDAAFNPDVEGDVTALALQTDGRLLVGGSYSRIAGAARASLARLQADGTIDAAFNPGANGRIRALVLQADGRILVGGEFTVIAGTNRPYLARLNADGSLDPAFAPQFSAPVAAVSLQADGRVLVGGAFTTANGAARRRLALLNADGSLDPAFVADANVDVLTLTLQPDGRPFVGGRFTSVNSQPHFLVARLAAADTAVQSVTVAADMATITWTRGGAAPELAAAEIALSTDGITWTTLGQARRTGRPGGWQLQTTPALPGGQYYFLRTRGYVPASAGSTYSLVESWWQFLGTTLSGSTPANTAADAQALEETNGAGATVGGPATGAGAETPANGPSSSPGSESAADARTNSRVASLSARLALNDSDTLVAGFVVTGGPKRVLLRAVGPGLAVFGLTGGIAAPQWQLFDSAGRSVAANAGWTDDPAVARLAAELGAFPLPAGSADAAAAVTLSPGAYTLQVRDRAANAGLVLAEVYDADAANTPSRLVNISARGPSGSGAGLLLGGFVVVGDSPLRLLVRGLGPGLAALGVPGTAADPVLRVHDAAGRVVAENDNWNAALAPVASAVGAFALGYGSLDAALDLTLPPGAYTVEVTGRDQPGAQALVEIYLAP